MWLVYAVLLLALALSSRFIRRALPFESLLAIGLATVSLFVLYETGRLQ